MSVSTRLLAARVMEHLGIPHARYRLIHGLVVIDGEERETWLNESPSFRAPDERKMAFDLFYDLNRRPGESPFDLARRYGWGPQVAALIIADYLIANRDRHGANIEVIRSPEGSVRLAPLFDSGLSFVFSCYGDEERVRAFDPLSDVNANNYLGTRSLEENFALRGRAGGDAPANAASRRGAHTGLDRWHRPRGIRCPCCEDARDACTALGASARGGHRRREPVGRPVEGGVVVFAFDIIDGRARNAVPCGRLFYDAERDEWGIQIAEGAGPEEVPFLFSSFVERGERAIGPAWARRWVAERVVPPGRQNLGEVLRANGLREYSEFALLAIGKGACSQDYFVLRGPFPVDDDGEILDDRRQLRQSIGCAVAEARREQGMTQKQLAERALVDQAVVSRVERGRANITSDLLADVACALGMCVEVTLAPAAVYNGEPDEGRSGL